MISSPSDKFQLTICKSPTFLSHIVYIRFSQSGSLSPDGNSFLSINKFKKAQCDLYDLQVPSGRRIQTFMDPDHPILPFNESNHPCNDNKHPTPFIFVNSGNWILGGGFGKINLWRTDTNVRVQKIPLLSESGTVTLLAVCDVSVGW